jgi:hypothetical protein
MVWAISSSARRPADEARGSAARYILATRGRPDDYIFLVDGSGDRRLGYEPDRAGEPQGFTPAAVAAVVPAAAVPARRRVCARAGDRAGRLPLVALVGRLLWVLACSSFLL